LREYESRVDARMVGSIVFTQSAKYSATV